VFCDQLERRRECSGRPRLLNVLDGKQIPAKINTASNIRSAIEMDLAGILEADYADLTEEAEIMPEAAPSSTPTT
jgi:hypothetical protein